MIRRSQVGSLHGDLLTGSAASRDRAPRRRDTLAARLWTATLGFLACGALLANVAHGARDHQEESRQHGAAHIAAGVSYAAPAAPEGLPPEVRALVRDGEDHAGDAFHWDDPMKAMEHQAMLDLVGYEEATHWAVAGGVWSSPATWAGAEVPPDGARVVVPAGVEVEYDVRSDVRLLTLRVDGGLRFARAVATRLVVDTLVVTPGGRLEVGSAAAPIAAEVRAEIVIADNGPIERVWDPQQLSRGLVLHGQTVMHGAAKTPFVKVALDPRAGDRAVTLAAAPEGWRVGDRIVIAGTHHVPKTLSPGADHHDWAHAYGVDHGTEDEVRTIAALDGATVWFDQPLSFDHDTPAADLKTVVANYSRNVRISSRHGGALPADQRGHVMFMHSAAVDVRYVEFDELGRTDKSQDLDDRIGQPIRAEDRNVRGRYAVHLHRTGDLADSAPSYLAGNAVWRSPGWGYVQHDSYALLEGNVAFDVYGAAFVAETGNEIGAWSGNLALKGTGRAVHIRDGSANFDLGGGGHGFWFQGRLITLSGNIAAGMSGDGFVWFAHTNTPGAIKARAAHLPHPAVADYVERVTQRVVSLKGIEDNEVFASTRGFESTRNAIAVGHDDRNLIDGFTAWEVVQGGFIEYSPHYTLDRLRLIATAKTSAVYGSGLKVNFRPEPHGLQLGNNLEDIVVRDALIEGFDGAGIRMRSAAPQARIMEPSSYDFGFRFIDCDLAGNGTPWSAEHRQLVDPVLSSAALVPGRLELQLDTASLIAHPQEGIRLTGTKRDSLGAVAFPSPADSFGISARALGLAAAADGYWTLADGTRVMLFKELYADRLTGRSELQTYAALIPDDVNLGAAAKHNGPFPYNPADNLLLHPDISAAVVPVAAAGWRPKPTWN